MRTHLVRTFTTDRFPRTVSDRGAWNMVETLESVGSVVTTLSTIGTTTVRIGR